MAIVLNDSAHGFAAGSYIRIDGVQFDPAPSHREDGVWSVDPATPVLFHLYVYRSAEARIAGHAPLTDEACATTLGELGLLDPLAGSATLRLGPAWTVRSVDAAILWQTLYSYLGRRYPRSVNVGGQNTPKWF